MKINPQQVYIIDWQDGLWRNDQRLHDLLRNVGAEMEWGNDNYHQINLAWADFNEDSARGQFEIELRNQGYTENDFILVHFWW